MTIIGSRGSDLVLAKPFNSRLHLVGIDAVRISSADQVGASLEQVIMSLREHVVELTSSVRVAVDLRADNDDPWGAQGAIIQATRGLIQSYTLEAGSAVFPVNLVVTSPSQERDRAATWRFLSDDDGGMSWGATFDLREVHA